MATKLSAVPVNKYDKENRSNYAYLLFVDSKSNKNKYYEISESADTHDLLVHYGRVGSSGIYMEYSSFDGKSFESLKTGKTEKGYVDKTANFSNKDVAIGKRQEALSSKPVEDPVVQKFLEEIVKASAQFMARNYTIKTSDVTLKMVTEAQSHIDNLHDIVNSNSASKLYNFNNELEELFETIPRSMKNVADNLARSSADCTKIIERETEMLNNVKGILKARGLENTTLDRNDKTMLEMYNLQAKRVSYKEEDTIVSYLGRDYNGSVERRFVRAFAVENNETRERYNKYRDDNNYHGKNDTKLFYHGSKLENWFSIYNQGLSLNPKAKITGKMFGQGLYFAPECRKALNYMDTVGSRWCDRAEQDHGYTAIFSVAVGKSYEPSKILGSNFTKKDLPQGCGSVFANKKKSLGLVNNEYIVYDQNACTIKYMLEMKSKFVPELEFNLDRKALKNQLIDHTSPLEKIGQNTYRTEILLDQMPSGDILKKALNMDIDDGKRLFIEYSKNKIELEIEFD
jgi:poly [ADP-ribose] polymerase